MHLSLRNKSKAAMAVGVVTLGLGLLGPANPAAVSVSASSPIGSSAGEEDCPSGPAHARLKGDGDGHDPNSVSLAEAKTMETELQSGIDRLKARAKARTTARGRHPRGFHLPKHVKINTYVHVITARDGTGNVTNRQIRAQMKVLNDGFAGRTAPNAARTPFHFRLKSIDRTANDDWYDWSNPDVDPSDDTEAKAALHRGSYRDLNVYIAALGDGLLGYASYPDDVLLAEDGLVLLNESLPGGAIAPYNEGDTATHEVGHWLALLHTFENGCTFPGDMVRDTPYQDDGENIFECKESLNTCPQRGRDPVHNFMSYGDDPCLDHFTKGQARRMTYAWLVFRARR